MTLITVSRHHRLNLRSKMRRHRHAAGKVRPVLLIWGKKLIRLRIEHAGFSSLYDQISLFLVPFPEVLILPDLRDFLLDFPLAIRRRLCLSYCHLGRMHLLDVFL